MTIDLVRHMKAKDRKKWTAPQDERPLSKLGLRQAEFQAEVMVQGERIVAVYTSPALRCRMTIAPVTMRLGLEAQVEPLLAETDGYVEPQGWQGFNFGADAPDSGNPMGPAHAAGRGLAFVNKILQARLPGGRIVACSHGDTIPLIVASLAGLHGIEPPAPLWGFGGWYRLRFDGEDVSMESFEPPEGFEAL